MLRHKKVEREQEAICGTAAVTSGEDAHGIEDSVSTLASKNMEIKIDDAPEVHAHGELFITAVLLTHLFVRGERDGGHQHVP